MKRNSSILAVVLLLATSGVASAQSFEAMAKEAVDIRTPEALAALFWSQTNRCNKINNDFRRRQCNGVKASRIEQIVAETYLVESSASNSFSASPFVKQTKSMDITIRACVECSGQVKVGGRARYIVGKGKRTIEGGALKASILVSTAKTFASDKNAADFTKFSVSRIRSEFLVRLPARVDSWKTGGLQGYTVDVIAIRIYDPCTGDIVFAKPSSGPAPTDRSTCTDEENKPAPAPIKKAPRKPTGPKIPEQLTNSQITKALSPMRKAAEACFDAYGVAGNTSLEITFDNNGLIIALEQKGDFNDTPTGKCVETAVRKVTFAKSKKKRTTVTYPLMLR